MTGTKIVFPETWIRKFLLNVNKKDTKRNVYTRCSIVFIEKYFVKGRLVFFACNIIGFSQVVETSNTDGNMNSLLKSLYYLTKNL